MKKLCFAILLSAGLFSCSDDNDSHDSSQNFFDYKVGDKWAYRYYQQNDTGVFVGRPTTDTVRIVGTTVIENQTYFDFETITYDSNGNGDYPDHEYLRVNEEGNLVKVDGRIKHPGSNTSFTATMPVYIADTEIGTYTTRLNPLESIVVEGISYQAYNYEGYYTSFNGAGAEGDAFKEYYSPGIGLVKSSTRYLYESGLKIEYRLLYHN
nr:hypothetical protein [uncultured Flavobacterium sp.]